MAKIKTKAHWLNYFRPTIFIKSYTNLNIFLLKKIGIKMLICDLDNTLSPHFTKWPNKKVINFCNEIRSNDIKLAIVSNNSKKRVLTYTSRLEVDEVIFNAKKPMKRKITKMLTRQNLRPNEVIFLGDQFITDIWTASRIGCKSILVSPITDELSDDSSSKLIKFLNKHIYRKLEHGNYLSLDKTRSESLNDEHQFI
ncbi:MAG: YqeG family HAD IIIA-type phosphatase [Mycoplasmataceae bacterium]|nr:YqeG family HAD IIIA-type phosphatase [Mycoplasmataceae bacterium]